MQVLRGTPDTLGSGKIWGGGDSSNLIDFIIPKGVIVVCQDVDGTALNIKVGDGVNTYPNLPDLSVKASLGFDINYGEDYPNPDSGDEGDIYFMVTNSLN